MVGGQLTEVGAVTCLRCLYLPPASSTGLGVRLYLPPPLKSPPPLCNRRLASKA